MFRCDVVTGWTCTFSGIGNMVQNPPASYFSGGMPDGVEAASIGTFGAHTNDDAFMQTLSATLLANTTYTLTVYVGRDNFAGNSFDPLKISLSANNVVLASDASAAPAKNSFVADTIVFNSGASPAQLGQALQISMIGTSAAGGEVWFDNVTLDASPTSAGAAPEPGTVAMLAGGLGLVLLGRRRRGRQ